MHDTVSKVFSATGQCFDAGTAAERVSSGTFRSVMREIAAPVAVIAAGPPGARNGLTATAVCGVSDDPPTILVCVKSDTRAHAAIGRYGFFSVNFLASDQEEIAKRFSGVSGVHGEDRFLTGKWSAGRSGAPLLGDALCRLECEIAGSRQAATHTVFFGEIIGADRRCDSGALLYLNGLYRALSPRTAPEK